MMLSEKEFVGVAITPSADIYNGDPASQTYSLARYGRCAFVVQHGAGATGTATFTVEACSDAGGTGAEAVPFSYRTGPANGALGAVQKATAAGFTLSAGANQVFVIDIRSDGVVEGKPYVRLKATEVVDGAVAGSVLAVLSDARYFAESMPDPTS